MWFDLIPPYPNLRLGSHEGYSFFSFGVLYLMGRAIKLYGIPYWIKKYSIIFYFLLSLPTAWYACRTTQLQIVFAYNSPLVIASSVCFLEVFLNMEFESRFINYIAKSTLAILLGHMAFSHVFKDQFRFIYQHYSGISLVGLWIISLLIVFGGSIIIDQIRLLLYKPLEAYLNKKIKHNELFKAHNKF